MTFVLYTIPFHSYSRGWWEWHNSKKIESGQIVAAWARTALHVSHNAFWLLPASYPEKLHIRIHLTAPCTKLKSQHVFMHRCKWINSFEVGEAKCCRGAHSHWASMKISFTAKAWITAWQVIQYILLLERGWKQSHIPVWFHRGLLAPAWIYYGPVPRVEPTVEPQRQHLRPLCPKHSLRAPDRQPKHRHPPLRFTWPDS